MPTSYGHASAHVCRASELAHVQGAGVVPADPALADPALAVLVPMAHARHDMAGSYWGVCRDRQRGCAMDLVFVLVATVG